jgi:hypothetical protein
MQGLKMYSVYYYYDYYDNYYYLNSSLTPCQLFVFKVRVVHNYIRTEDQESRESKHL